MKLLIRRSKLTFVIFILTLLLNIEPAYAMQRPKGSLFQQTVHWVWDNACAISVLRTYALSELRSRIELALATHFQPQQNQETHSLYTVHDITGSVTTAFPNPIEGGASIQCKTELFEILKNYASSHEVKIIDLSKLENEIRNQLNGTCPVSKDKKVLEDGAFLLEEFMRVAAIRNWIANQSNSRTTLFEKLKLIQDFLKDNSEVAIKNTLSRRLNSMIENLSIQDKPLMPLKELGILYLLLQKNHLEDSISIADAASIINQLHELSLVYLKEEYKAFFKKKFHDCNSIETLIKDVEIFLNKYTPVDFEVMQDAIKKYEGYAEKSIGSIRGEITDSSRTQAYGGEPGRKYFNHRYELVIEPALVDFLKLMKGEKASSRRFESLLDVLGAERRKISIIVSSSMDFLDFGGSFDIFGKPLRDPIISYDSWSKYLLRSLAYNQADHCNLNDDVLAEILAENLSRVLGAKATYHEYGIFIVRSTEKGFGEIEIVFERSQYLPLISSVFWNRPSRMYMSHLAKLDTELDVLASSFYAALNSKSKAELIDALGLFLLRMSHGSVFDRGQAAIILSLLKCTAKAHGYDLIFSAMWQEPNMSPDIHALSTFNTELFLTRFRENVELRDIVGN